MYDVPRSLQVSTSSKVFVMGSRPFESSKKEDSVTSTCAYSQLRITERKIPEATMAHYLRGRTMIHLSDLTTTEHIGDLVAPDPIPAFLPTGAAQSLDAAVE